MLGRQHWSRQRTVCRVQHTTLHYCSPLGCPGSGRLYEALYSAHSVAYSAPTIAFTIATSQLWPCTQGSLKVHSRVLCMRSVDHLKIRSQCRHERRCGSHRSGHGEGTTGGERPRGQPQAGAGRQLPGLGPCTGAINESTVMFSSLGDVK